MSALTALRERGPAALKLSLGGGQGFDVGPFWQNSSAAHWSPVLSGREQIANDFESYVERIYKRNGIAYACIAARALPFSEAQLLFQKQVDGRPAGLHATGGDLSVLEEPWPRATTGDLLLRMEQDASLAGNSFWTTRALRSGRPPRLRRLRPDWMTIVSGVHNDPDPDLKPWDLDAEVLAYIYQPRSVGRVYDAVVLSPAEVVHWAPMPDPILQWRGMSWITPVLRELAGDDAATEHKLKFFQNGATPPIVLSYDASVGEDAFNLAVRLFEQQHAGVKNAYKALHVGGGADAEVVGANLKQIDFKSTQGAGETRIAAASGVGAIIARFSEGMQGSSLNQGNYGAAKRQFADMVLRPNWRSAVSALRPAATVPAGSKLWYDDAIPFLQEDAEDAAVILGKQAAAINALVTNGFEPDVAVRAVVDGDLSALVGNHNGLPSVQQQAAADIDSPAAAGSGGS